MLRVLVVHRPSVEKVPQKLRKKRWGHLMEPNQSRHVRFASPLRCESLAAKQHTRNMGGSMQERLTRTLLVSTTSCSICEEDILPSSMSSRRSSTPGLRQCRRADSMDDMPPDVSEQLFYLSVCPSVLPSVGPSVRPSVCLSVSVCVCLSQGLGASCCLSVSLFLSLSPVLFLHVVFCGVCVCVGVS